MKLVLDNKKAPLLFCSALLFAHLTGCGGSGFASGPASTDSETPDAANFANEETISADVNDDITGTPGAVETTPPPPPSFDPPNNALLSVDADTVSINGLAPYTTICVSFGISYPTLEGGVCGGDDNVQQLENTPDELRVTLSCANSELNGATSHIPMIKLAYADAQGQVAYTEVQYVQPCSETSPPPEQPTPDTPQDPLVPEQPTPVDPQDPVPAEPDPIIPPPPEIDPPTPPEPAAPSRLLAAIAIGRPDFTYLENIEVSYAIGFAGQYMPDGEVLSLFRAGEIAPDCAPNGNAIMNAAINASSGQISFPPQPDIGAYQVQVRDKNGCHLGEPKTVNVVEPEITFVQLTEGVNDYKGVQDTTLFKLGLNMTIPQGDEKDLWIYEIDPLNGEMAALVQWDMPEGLAGIVLDASLQFEVTQASNAVFNIYAMAAPWDEKTAIWITANLNANQGNVLLGTLSPNNRGIAIAELNDAGVSLVQAWVNGEAQNYGFVLRAQANSNGAVELKSSDERDKSERPTLNISIVEP